jgi:hypothetical protein
MLNQQEFEAILGDESKRIEGDIAWRDDPEHSPAREFRVELRSDVGWPLFVVGRFNPWAGTLTYALIHRGAGRIYGLDLGADHHNPGCEYMGRKHKHRWTEAFRDKEAYVPPDITEPWDQPVRVWRQFCDEARIAHTGALFEPIIQDGLPL